MQQQATKRHVSKCKCSLGWFYVSHQPRAAPPRAQHHQPLPACAKDKTGQAPNKHVQQQQHCRTKPAVAGSVSSGSHSPARCEREDRACRCQVTKLTSRSAGDAASQAAASPPAAAALHAPAILTASVGVTCSCRTIQLPPKPPSAAASWRSSACGRSLLMAPRCGPAQLDPSFDRSDLPKARLGLAAGDSSCTGRAAAADVALFAGRWNGLRVRVLLQAAVHDPIGFTVRY